MTNKKLLVIIAAASVLLIAILLVNNFSVRQSDPTSINSFEECADAGYPIMESYPAQCRVTETGKLFIEIIEVSTTPPPISDNECVIGGCSGTICQDAGEEPAITTCEFRAEYACYQSAKCERQINNKCGWTQSASLTSCLKNPPPLN